MDRLAHSRAVRGLVSVLIVVLQLGAVYAGEVDRLADGWLSRCSLMRGFVKRSVGAVLPVQGVGAGCAVFVVTLEPTGFLVIVPSQSERPVVSFCLGGNADLRSHPGNGFLKVLQHHASHASSDLSLQSSKSGALAAMGQTAYVPPLLGTQWGQWRHYNAHCPEEPTVPDVYDGRVPAGCVPLAYGQVMRFHAWPPVGEGVVEHHDDHGELTGQFRVDFRDGYAWSLMRSSYNLYQDESSGEVDAVAELLYELGVLLGIDYEGADSVCRMDDGLEGLHRFLLYKDATLLHVSEGLAEALRNDVIRGIPALVSVPATSELPGHVAVVDGYYQQDGVDYFHVNYGWDGINNGWYTLTDLMERVVDFGVVGICPQLLALPLHESVAWGRDRQLRGRWVIPRGQAEEVEQIRLYEVAPTNSVWLHEADTFADVHVAALGYRDWVVETNDDRVLFYKRAGGYSDTQYTLTFDTWVTPGTQMVVELMHRYDLAEDDYWLALSTNGVDFLRIWERTGAVSSWAVDSVVVSNRVGVPVLLRLGYGTGLYYPNGGVWVDSIAVQGASHDEPILVGCITNLTIPRPLLRTNGTYRTDSFDDFVQTQMWDYVDWTLASDAGVSVFRKEAGGYAGVTYDLVGRSPVEIHENSYLAVDYRATLAGDRFEVGVVDAAGVYRACWNAPHSDEWRTEYVPLDGAGEEVRLVLRYVVGTYYWQQGVWVQGVRFMGIDNFACMDQPAIDTRLPELSIGNHRIATEVVTASGVQPLSPPVELHVLGPPDDGDGMPESWELAYGLDLFSDDGSGDADGDGVANRAEYVAGTDPTAAGSALAVSMDSSGAGLYGVTGRIYWIEYKSSLLDSEWHVEGGAVFGTNGPIVLPICREGDMRFYRARVELDGEQSAVALNDDGVGFVFGE